MTFVRAVFVNHCHPDVPHVCAMRARELARALAARGHRIVLLTETLTPDEAGIHPAALAPALAIHDWSRPYVLAVRPRAAAPTRALQRHRLAPPLSQAMVAWCYVVRGGVFWTWTAASRPFWPVLVRAFAPEVTWATFGNVDALDIARGIAQAATCPWVLDLKDPWDGFVPPLFQHRVARRYRDAAAVTALSQAHAHAAARWFGKATVVYSGIGEALLAPRGEEAPPAGERRLVLTGSVYDDTDLDTLMGAVAEFLAGRKGDTPSWALVYGGGDYGRVARAAQAVRDLCRTDIRPWIAGHELAALRAGAVANLYVKGRSTPFHHKLLELLAAGRPVICHPEESEEARRIAGEAGVPFYSCSDRTALCAALAQVADAAAVGAGFAVDRRALARYTWEVQAAILERVLEEARRKRT